MLYCVPGRKLDCVSPMCGFNKERLNVWFMVEQGGLTAIQLAFAATWGQTPQKSSGFLCGKSTGSLAEVHSCRLITRIWQVPPNFCQNNQKSEILDLPENKGTYSISGQKKCAGLLDCQFWGYLQLCMTIAQDASVSTSDGILSTIFRMTSARHISVYSILGTGPSMLSYHSGESLMHVDASHMKYRKSEGILECPRMQYKHFALWPRESLGLIF